MSEHVDPRPRDGAKPIDDARAHALLAPALRLAPRIALAVSGGADSRGLMHLAARACAIDPELPRPVVLTVDHSSSPTSNLIAARVGEWAAAAGFEAHVLPWEWPESGGGSQETWREGRYRLLMHGVAIHRCAGVVVAHTAEDQAETLLMRLARGDGVHGLAAMHEDYLYYTLRILRPLLDVAHAELVATLRAAGLDWIDDPANSDDAYERTHWRKRRAALDAAGIGVDALVRSARRLARADAAIVAMSVDFHAAARRDDGSVDLAMWLAAPEEIAIRELQWAVDAHDPYGPSLGSFERVVAAFRAGRRGPLSLGNCLVRADGDALRVAPEPPRRRGQDS